MKKEQKSFKFSKLNLEMLASVYVRDGYVTKSKYSDKSEMTVDIIECYKKEKNKICIEDNGVVECYFPDGELEYLKGIQDDIKIM